MPLDFDLYLLPKDMYSDFEFQPAPAYQNSHGLRSNKQNHVHQKATSFSNRKWTADDNVANDFLESSAKFHLDQHYNAEATLRNNLSSSKLCYLDENSQHNSVNSNKLQKKRQVSFADSRGLPLVSVHFIEDISNFLNENHPYGLTFYRRISNTDSNNNEEKGSKLSPCFEQPVANYTQFLHKLEQTNISLENIMIDEKAVRGTLKVKNMALEKKVKVRCSYDCWNSYTDIPGTYVSSCAYSNMDTFTFEFTTAPCITQMEFALQYLVNGQEFWDNNDGQNYKLQR